MSDKSLLRRTTIDVTLDGVKITDDVAARLISFRFTDVEDGASDDIEITLQDSDNKVIGAWLNNEITKRGNNAARLVELKCPYSEPGSEVKQTKTNKKKAENTVKWLQWYLKKAGYTKQNVSGLFTEATKNNLKSFQRKHGLKVTGTLNKNTRKKLKTVANENISNKKVSLAAKYGKLGIAINQLNDKGDGKDYILNCGTFEIDEVSMSGPPQTVTISATSCGFGSKIRTTKRKHTWKSTNLKNIVETIAKRNGYSMSYLTTQNPKVKVKQQAKQTDIAFLTKFCKSRGVNCKVTDGTIIIYDSSLKSLASAVKTVKRKDGSYKNYSFSTSLSKTAYTGCELTYTTVFGKTYTAKVTAKGMKWDDDTALSVTDEPVTSNAEAKEVAKSKLFDSNKGETTCSMTFKGSVELCAGRKVKLQDFGAFSGTYVIEESEHTISRSGYETKVDMRKDN